MLWRLRRTPRAIPIPNFRFSIPRMLLWSLTMSRFDQIRSDFGELYSQKFLHFGHWISNGAGKFSPFPNMHQYFYSRCNSIDMGKNYVEIQGGSGDPPCPFLAGAPMLVTVRDRDVANRELTDHQKPLTGVSRDYRRPSISREVVHHLHVFSNADNRKA